MQLDFLCTAGLAKHLLAKLEHNALFQAGNIGLGNTQQRSNLLLRHFLPVCRIESKTQTDDRPFTLRQAVYRLK